MHLHGVAVAHHDSAAYRGADEDDGCVFRLSAFEGGLTRDDFSPLLDWVLGSFTSFGVDPQLPYVLKHFGYACAYPRHPGRAFVEYNYEREWTWSLTNLIMSEGSTNKWVFIQPSGTLAYLERFVVGLSIGTLHLLAPRRGDYSGCQR